MLPYLALAGCNPVDGYSGFYTNAGMLVPTFTIAAASSSSNGKGDAELAWNELSKLYRLKRDRPRGNW